MTAAERPSEYSLRGRWVIPGDGRVLSPGVVEIAHGQIVEVHDRTFGDATRDAVIDLGPVAILPALINAHTHLEFSDLTQPVTPASPFAAWIRGVIATRRGRSLPVDEVVRAGWSECCAGGAGAIGEICTDEVGALTLERIGVAGVIFREFLGLSDAAVATQLDVASHFLETDNSSSNMTSPLGVQSRCLQRGLSPHAPYSVHPELFEGLIDLACAKLAPVAMHIAETEEELELLFRGTGPLVDLFSEMGLWRPELFESRTTPQRYLEQLAQCPRALVVHGNYLTDAELSRIASTPSLSLVYCPRTHAGFGHREHPWQKLLAAGGRVVIGTDSRASNPDLNLFAELQWLQQRHPDVSSLKLLELATTAPATALGLPEGMGAILHQTPACLAIVSWPDNAVPTSTNHLMTGGLYRGASIRRFD